MSTHNFPQAFQETKTVDKKRISVFAARSREEMLDEKEIERAEGRVTTFDVYILSRKNSSWQGEIIFNNNKTPFESTLQLLQIVANILK